MGTDRKAKQPMTIRRHNRICRSDRSFSTFSDCITSSCSEMMLLDGLEECRGRPLYMSARRLTLLVQDSRTCEKVVFVACERKRGPLVKCRGNLHVEKPLEKDVRCGCC
jgi:hypothetical protein